MIRVLGPIQVVTVEGRTVDLPSASQRRLLAVLARHAPKPVRAERLAAVLEVSPSVRRRRVTPVRSPLGDGAVASIAGGYQLSSPVDAHEFCRAVVGATLTADVLPALERALELWIGPPYDEFGTAPSSEVRCIEQRIAAGWDGSDTRAIAMPVAAR